MRTRCRLRRRTASSLADLHEHACRLWFIPFVFLYLLEADPDFFRQDLLTYA